ncbi:MAG: hypothetical protein ACO1QB_12080 [Verrucomicrobiales bacterium]
MQLKTPRNIQSSIEKINEATELIKQLGGHFQSLQKLDKNLQLLKLSGPSPEHEIQFCKSKAATLERRIEIMNALEETVQKLGPLSSSLPDAAKYLNLAAPVAFAAIGVVRTAGSGAYDVFGQAFVNAALGLQRYQ